MSLTIYSSVTPNSGHSTDGSFINPLSHSFNGTTGEVIQKRYYVRNDNAGFYYEDITVQPVDGGDNIVDGSGATDGFMWQLITGDQQPLEAQWAETLAVPGTAISLPNIGSSIDGDTRTFVPFWLRITVPVGANVKSYQDVTLKISATEGIVA